MNESLQQAYDFLDESNAVYDLLSSLSDKEFDQPTQFKGWSFNDVIGHLHVWNYAADISLSDGEDWIEFSNKALKALGSGSKEALLPNNVEKVMSAPVIAIIGYDLDFSDNMSKLFPHMDVAPMYKGNAEFNQATAFRNSSLQGAYFMMVSRALGLDCGPMSGFNNDLVDQTFFKDTNIKSNFLCCIGYGDPSKIFMRLPRLDFDDACEIL